MSQIKAYHRPSTINEALQLLSRSGVNTTIVAGGTYITAHLSETMVDEVIDLQSIGLTEISHQGDRLTLGAMVRLQAIVDDEQSPTLLREVAYRTGPNTFRHAATIGGTVVSADKESELLAALLVFEAEVQIQSANGTKDMPLANFLPHIATELGDGIVTTLSLATTGKTASAWVARTPADRPIVAAAARLAPDGQLHLALCGVADTPILVDPDNIKGTVNPWSDFRGSKEYRRQMAATLANRVIAKVSDEEKAI